MKKSVFLSDSTVDFLSFVSKSRDDDSVLWSGGINGSIQALKNIISLSVPELTIKEWEAVLSVFNGSFEPAFQPAALNIASCMMDDRGEISLSELQKGDPEYAELVVKIHNLTAAEQYAVLFVCQAFWIHGVPLDEILDKFKFKKYNKNFDTEKHM